MFRRKLFFVLAGAAALAFLVLSGCVVKEKEEAARIVPAEGVTLPALTGLVWLGAEFFAEGENSGGEYFASAADDGLTRVWEVFSGRMVFASSSREEILALASDSAAVELNALWETENAPEVTKPGGTRKISPSEDGSVLLSDAESGKELARYYGFGPGGAIPPGGVSGDKTETEKTSAGISPGWISVVPEGFYNTSLADESPLSGPAGSSFLIAEKGERRRSLRQLSGALFRPDLFTAVLKGEVPEAPETLESLLNGANTPPLVSVSPEGEGQPGTLTIKITEQEGGAGLFALYRRDKGQEIPAGLFWTEKEAAKKYTENGKTCYEIQVNLEEGETGVSVFNNSNTIESERLWFDFPGSSRNASGETPPGETDEAGKPVLKALLADYGESGSAAAFEAFFAGEEEGELFSKAEVKTLSGESRNRAGFVRAFEELKPEADKSGVFLLYIRGSAAADSSGDLRVTGFKPAPSAGEDENGAASGGMIRGIDILEQVLKTGAASLIILDLESPLSPEKTKSALLRFRERLGPKAMLAVYGPGLSSGGKAGAGETISFAGPLLEKLRPAFTGAELSAYTEENRFIAASEFFALAGTIPAPGPGGPENIAKREILAFPPREDFRIAGRFLGAGELKFQTMASGMLKIDEVDKNPVSLPFGETMTRALPPGSYIIDMIYRNGYRETRTVELRQKDSKWVIFTYTPPLLVGDFSRQLPALGINTAELNPANYEKVNREAMESMGMAPFYVAFLGGEKFYKEEKYDDAIAEYGRAISLKADYAGAWVSRGSAWRKKGDLDKAIADYTRALALKSGDAAVYNYRGFAFALKGDQTRAIADYTEAIRRDAAYADAYFNRAYAHSEQGLWEKAIADYTQVIKLEPSNALAFNQRAKAYQNKGDEPAAALDFAAAEKLLQK